MAHPSLGSRGTWAAPQSLRLPSVGYPITMKFGSDSGDRTIPWHHLEKHLSKDLLACFKTTTGMNKGSTRVDGEVREADGESISPECLGPQMGYSKQSAAVLLINWRWLGGGGGPGERLVLSLGEKMGMDQGGVVSGSRVYFQVRRVGSGGSGEGALGGRADGGEGGEAGTRPMVQETEVLPGSGRPAGYCRDWGPVWPGLGVTGRQGWAMWC